jgi:hypothetical protein
VSDYRAFAGHDVALGSLTVLTPQPRSRGLQVTERTYGLSGSANEQGTYIELIYDFINTNTDYQVLLALFGVNTALYADVTIYVPRTDYDYARFNAVAHRPRIGQDGEHSNYFLRNFTFLFTHCSILSEP